jgi:calcineurin-like phosphoesterase family protein
MGDGVRACLVHITDLHVGSKFNEVVWESFLDRCAELQPDIILATGDLVDSPWRWSRGSLRSARDKLYEARRKVEGAGRPAPGADAKNCRLLVVPGNHDTRIFGVAPLRRLFTPLVVCLAIAIVAAVIAHPLGRFRVEILCGALAAMTVVWLIYMLSFARFYSCFGSDEAVTAPTRVPCDGVTLEIFPFDSASFPIVLAGGHVRLNEFVRSRRAGLTSATKSEEEPQAVYRIAALHHHPLPIPYDDALEETLVLRNAGALLLEMAKLDVRLMLHGHKHHWHFARAPIEIGGGAVREVAVLGGSTLARGLGRADGDVFGFNVVRIDGRGAARISRYTSAGGPFDVEREFDVDDVAEQSRWLQRAAAKRYGVACRQMVDTTEINLDGDAERRWEVRGFRVEPGRSCDSMPGGRELAVSVGHIERVEARPLSLHGPRLLRWETESQLIRKHQGKIVFGRSVDSSEDPFDFFRRWHEVNSYAMTSGQFRRMYPGEPSPAYEFVSVRTPVFPCDRFRLSVYFPPRFEIDGHPDLEIRGLDGRRISRLEAEWRPALFYSALDTAISLDIVSPPPDVQILIRWRLVDRDPPEGLRVSSLQGEAKELAGWLLSVRKDHAVQVNADTWQRLCDIISRVEDSVRMVFKLPSRDKEPLDVSIAAYDPQEERLRFVLGNFPADSPAWTVRLAYGDGIAGRAYKANQARWFMKARAEKTNTPYYYFPTRGALVGEGIKDEVVFSVPLTHKREPTELYGVLSVSSKRPASPLVDQDEQSSTRVALEALNQLCFENLVAEYERRAGLVQPE